MMDTDTETFQDRETIERRSFWVLDLFRCHEPGRRPALQPRIAMGHPGSQDEDCWEARPHLLSSPPGRGNDRWMIPVLRKTVRPIPPALFLRPAGRVSPRRVMLLAPNGDSISSNALISEKRPVFKRFLTECVSVFKR